MKYFVLILLLSGCGSILDSDRTEKKLIDFKTKEKKEQSFKGEIKTEYPQASKQDINLNASGNSSIRLSLPPVKDSGLVSWQTKQQGETAEESEERFVIDKWLKSVSTAGWSLLIFSILVLLVVIVYFIKRTAIGKAADAAIGAGIDVTQKTIHSLTEKLMHIDPNTDEWNRWNEAREGHNRELATLIDKRKPKKK